VDTETFPQEASSVSRAALSLEISRLVPRLLRGEAIDLAGQGDELAARFPDLGMTGAMIGSAIERAAGMVDLIRNGHEITAPAEAQDEAEAVVDVLEETAEPALMNGNGAEHANGHGGDLPSEFPPTDAADFIETDADLAHLSAMLSEPISNMPAPDDHGPPETATASNVMPRDPAGGFGFIAKSAFRRAFSRGR
jgi:hypothetical protein